MISMPRDLEALIQSSCLKIRLPQSLEADRREPQTFSGIEVAMAYRGVFFSQATTAAWGDSGVKDPCLGFHFLWLMRLRLERLVISLAKPGMGSSWPGQTPAQEQHKEVDKGRSVCPLEKG